MTVLLGEPSYISARNSAIELQAAGGTAPFDGYIGFHFEVDGKKTIDVPVVARAVLKPQKSWLFKTWVQIEEAPGWRESVSLNRELVIEWRDRSMRVIAKKSLGKPPWREAAPLRVVRDGEMVENPCCLGAEAHVRRPADLPSIAQWYSGFSEMIVRTDLWLDLPPPVREAAFSSGIRIVFVGSPRSGQQLTPLDRALIPVEFGNEAGEYAVPWPYATGTSRLTTPVTWRRKKNTVVVGDAGVPYLAAHRRAVFTADASMLTMPLPGMFARSNYNWGGGKPIVTNRISFFVTEFRVAIIGIALVLLSIALIFLIRRNVRVPAVVGVVVVAGTILACRDQLRPRSARVVQEEWIPVTADIVRHVTDIGEYGPTPIPEHSLSSEEQRLSVSKRGRVRQEAEVRTSQTAPGHGAMYLHRDGSPWDTTSRWSARHELGQPVKITVRSFDKQKLTFDFEAPFAADYATAQWVFDGAEYAGETRIGGARTGRAVVEHRHSIPTLRYLERGQEPTENIRIVLTEKSRERTRMAGWSEPLATDIKSDVVRVWRGVLAWQTDGTMRHAFALPPIAPDAAAFVIVHTTRPMKSVSVQNATGISPLRQEGNVNRYVVDADAVRRIAAGGFVMVSAEPPERPAELPAVSIIVKEKRS